MPAAVKDQLWRLINSLGKSEKRNFKLYATRAGATSDNKFIKLFDALDRQDTPDDKAITTRLKLSSGQYSNLKRHLYQQVLTSLRLIYISKEIDIELREQIDFAHMLYGKGLFLDALRGLERAKGRAVEHNRDLLHLEILEFQKLIEARHITLSRQVDNKMDQLLNESAARSYSVLNTSELINLNIQIHGRYIEAGHSRTQEDTLENERFWHHIQTRRIDRETVASTFHQQINRFQAAMWYQYIQLDFAEAREAALNAYNLFALYPHMTVKDPVLYLRCLYYVGIFSYLTGGPGDRTARYQEKLHNFLESNLDNLNENSRRIGHVYDNLLRLNAYFGNGDWQAARTLADGLLEFHTSGKFRPTNHRWGQFLYKFAAARFMLGEYGEALDHLNDIINVKLGILREDLLLNTRLLMILCHYELGNLSLVDYNLTSFVRQLRRGREAAEVHRYAVAGLRKLVKSLPDERNAIYRELYNDIQAVADRPFEAKALLYLDLRLWLAKHLEPLSITQLQTGLPMLDK